MTAPVLLQPAGVVLPGPAGVTTVNLALLRAIGIGVPASYKSIISFGRNAMTRMMETLESRQMFSAAPVEPIAPPADTSAPTEDVVSEKTGTSGAMLFKNCCAGSHYKNVVIDMG